MDTNQTYKHKIRCKHHYQTGTWTQTKHTHIRYTLSITIKQTHVHTATYKHTIRCKHHYQTSTWTQTKHTHIRYTVSITIKQTHVHKPNIQTYDTLYASLSNKRMYTNQTYKHTIHCKHHYQTNTWTQTKHTNIQYTVSITIKQIHVHKPNIQT